MAGISLAAAKARAESMHDTAVSGRRMELMSYDGRNIIEQIETYCSFIGWRVVTETVPEATCYMCTRQIPLE